MNFWADVAFTPSYGGIITRVAARPRQSPAIGGFGIAVDSTSQPNGRPLFSTTAAIPTGLGRFVAGSRVTLPVVRSAMSNRGPVPQALTAPSWLLSRRGH
jgi:hypothetical protein